MIKLRKCLYLDSGKKAMKVSNTVKGYENVYDAFRECYLEVFHMPSNFELSLETMEGKTSREIATFYGMEGSINWEGNR